MKCHKLTFRLPDGSIKIILGLLLKKTESFVLFKTTWRTWQIKTEDIIRLELTQIDYISKDDIMETKTEGQNDF